MAPLFETIKSFNDVPITSDGVETASFLEAMDGVLTMFDLFGSTVFGFVQSDIRGNISGVRARYQQARTDSETLEALVQCEATAGDKHKHGTACLVRLFRGLAFIQHSLQHMQNHPNEELHVCFRNAYEVTLKHHHAWVVRQVLHVAFRAVPHRRDFYGTISSGASPEKFDPEFGKWLDALEKIVKRMKGFLEGGGYGKV
ncbi:glycolipid transfer protein [Gymnopus androsaceus JB14]|uniref:Glycolipid transfer protein n=1 Tax=Gymnopus androsaceus JB14 TaxID=1447944 RepID=A0A6A4GVD5_9AGAR|nr:glycolipid transfer protein [Gymnopus androsaceus JB14]